MSRTIDALIAEKCMGWRLVTDVAELSRLECRPGPDPKAAERHNRGLYFLGEERVGCLECGDIPEYSTDLTRAFEALEKMREKGWYTRLESTPAGRHACVVWRNGQISTGRAESLSLAICRAILAALNVPIPEETK